MKKKFTKNHNRKKPKAMLRLPDLEHAKSAVLNSLILRVNWLRWTFTVASLVPIEAAICLLSRPKTTSGRISRSRGVSDSNRSSSN